MKVQTKDKGIPCCFFGWFFWLLYSLQKCYLGPVHRPRQYLSLSLSTEITLLWFWSHFLIRSGHWRNCNGETEDSFATFLAITIDWHFLCFYIEMFDDLIQIVLVVLTRFYCALWHSNKVRCKSIYKKSGNFLFLE